MRLVRVGAAGAERPAIIDDEGGLRDTSSVVTDYDRRFLADGDLARLLDMEVLSLPLLDAGERIGPPIADPGKIVCVGLNYRKHAQEAGSSVPEVPVLFLKAPDSAVGPGDDILIPKGSHSTDYEVELAAVIGTTARYLADTSEALTYLAGYTICNDVSERQFQFEPSGQWTRGKNCETFTPLGPWLVTRDELPDPQALRLTTHVNGQLRQDGNTADMVFTVAEVIAYISRFMTLYPGDIVITGTPSGVGHGFDPPRYLRAGDELELSIAGLGSQRSRMADA